MKTSKVFWNGNDRHEIWSEYVNGKTDYWEKINGISYPISKRQYNNRVKKLLETQKD